VIDMQAVTATMGTVNRAQTRTLLSRPQDAWPVRSLRKSSELMGKRGG